MVTGVPLCCSIPHLFGAIMDTTQLATSAGAMDCRIHELLLERQIEGGLRIPAPILARVHTVRLTAETAVQVSQHLCAYDWDPPSLPPNHGCVCAQWFFWASVHPRRIMTEVLHTFAGADSIHVFLSERPAPCCPAGDVCSVCLMALLDLSSAGSWQTLPSPSLGESSQQPPLVND